MMLSTETRHWNTMVFPSLGQWLPWVIDGWNRETKSERNSLAEIALKERGEADVRSKYYLWFVAEQSCASIHPIPGRFNKDTCDGHTETAELIQGCSRLQAGLSSYFQWTRKIKYIVFRAGFFLFFSDTFDCLTYSSDSNTMLNLVNGCRLLLCMVPRGFASQVQQRCTTQNPEKSVISKNKYFKWWHLYCHTAGGETLGEVAWKQQTKKVLVLFSVLLLQPLLKTWKS